MVDGEDGWVRLLVLVSERAWDRKRAIFIIAGLDPETTWAAGDPFPMHLVLLAGGLRPEWEGLTPKQLNARQLDALIITETKLHGLAASMPPSAWLSEAMRRRQVPPWFDRAHCKKGLRRLLPLKPNASRVGIWDRQKTQVRRYWDAWYFGEADYESEGAFTRHMLAVVKADRLEFATIQQWIAAWRVETLVAYGDVPLIGAALDGQPGRESVRRGYGHPGIVSRARSGRPSKT